VRRLSNLLGGLTFVSLASFSKGNYFFSLTVMVGPAETNGRSEWRLATFPNWSSRGKPEKTMNKLSKLKRLFSPTTLAATVATGMLASSVVVMATCTEVSAVGLPPLRCPSGETCVQQQCVKQAGGFSYYFCCLWTQTCGLVTWVDPNNICNAIAQCCTN